MTSEEAKEYVTSRLKYIREFMPKYAKEVQELINSIPFPVTFHLNYKFPFSTVYIAYLSDKEKKMLKGVDFPFPMRGLNSWGKVLSGQGWKVDIWAELESESIRVYPDLLQIPKQHIQAKAIYYDKYDEMDAVTKLRPTEKQFTQLTNRLEKMMKQIVNRYRVIT